MNARSFACRGVASLIVAALFGVVFGCGGSSDDGGMTPSTCVTFVSAGAATTFTVVPGAAACTSVEVRVLLNDVQNVYGGGFEVTFDPAIVRYNGVDVTDSRLGTDGTTLFVLEPDPADWPGLGTVTVGVTRSVVLNGVDFTPSDEFCALNFSKVANSGSTGLTLSELKLQDPNGNNFVNVTASGGSFTIR